MKKLIIRNFCIDLTTFFMAILMLTGLIVWAIQAINFFDFVTEDGHGLKVYFFYSILNFPKIIYKLFPFILFISLFYIIIRYENKNEISIFWISGITKKQFVNDLLIFSLILMIIQLVLGMYISPLSKLKARYYIKNSNINFFTSLIKQGKFINITKGLTIFIDKKNKDGSFENIFLEEINKNKSKMIYAKKGFLIDNDTYKALNLFEGRIIDIENSKINIFKFDRINFNLKNLNTKTITTPKLQELDTLSLLSCVFYIENKKFKDFNCHKNIINEVKVELINRIHKPLYTPVIILFCCFLILFSKKQANYNYKRNIIFIIGFLLLIFSEVTVRYSIISNSLMNAYLISPIIILIYGYLLFSKLSKNV